MTIKIKIEVERKIQSLAQIIADRTKGAVVYPKDTRFNRWQGADPSATCLGKATLAPGELEKVLLSKGYGDQNLHSLPDSNKELLINSIFKTIETVVHAHYPETGLLLLADEAYPTGYIFSSAPKKPADDAPSPSPSPHRKAAAQQAKNKTTSQKTESPSNRRRQRMQQAHAMRLQRRAMTQQTKATDKEEEKKSQRHKHQEHHYTYQQPTWWPKDDGLTR
ncbi:hypothetical protein [Limosilactobacillus oris]|uniref:hypothetical protein n=1 Tax=Limosilactobacillus oris TaxID=1632 RepID=UPI0024B336EE|nr:hypothetical protein [Limosilactobacillus oris]WHO86639.1 hypothetical protein QLX69_10250 [Limosilactobacillus oris]